MAKKNPIKEDEIWREINKTEAKKLFVVLLKMPSEGYLESILASPVELQAWLIQTA